MTALGFFIPIVGLILYLVWKDQTPLKAKSAGKGALIGAIVLDGSERNTCDSGVCNSVANFLFLLLNARYFMMKMKKFMQIMALLLVVFSVLSLTACKKYHMSEEEIKEACISNSFDYDKKNDSARLVVDVTILPPEKVFAAIEEYVESVRYLSVGRCRRSKQSRGFIPIYSLYD